MGNTQLVAIPKEKKERWDGVVISKGRYNVEGPVAYEYLCTHTMPELILHRDDFSSVIVLGEKDEQSYFMAKVEGIGDGETTFILGEERTHPDGDPVMMGLRSFDHAEELQDVMRNAEARGYHRIGAIVVLEPCEDEDAGSDLKHIGKLLKVPYVMNGQTTYIEVPIFVVHREGDDLFEKVSDLTPSGVQQTLEITFGHEMRPKKVGWLVEPDFVPVHECTALTGQMDTRKSSAAINIAASGSLMRPWFTGAANNHKPFITVFACAEDSYDTTVLPRYIAAGGYMPHLACLRLNVTCKKPTADGMQEWEVPFNFDEYLNLLANEITKINNNHVAKVGLLINDPIISFFGTKNHNNAQDARDIMRGLKQLCEELKITIINVCHFNKTQGHNAKEKTGGSKALIEAHRMAWAFDLEDDPQYTLIAPVKHNLLKEARSYRITTVNTKIRYPIGYRQHQRDEVGVVKFVGYSKVTADEAIEAHEDKDKTKKKELRTAILDMCKVEQLAGNVCNQLSREFNCSVRTIQRTADQLVSEDKLKKSGTNSKNFTWKTLTEAEQPTFDEVTK